MLENVAPASQDFIGSICGRAVDAIDGRPLTNLVLPFANVEVQHFEDVGCVSLFSMQPEADGRFLIDGRERRLLPGAYRVNVRVEDYLPAASGRLRVAHGENADMGDVALAPVPIRIDVITPCVILPGGLCEWDVLVTNRSGGRFSGVAWSIVEVLGAGPAPLRVRFQVDPEGDTPGSPGTLSLEQDESSPLRFALRMPPSVPAGTKLRASVYVGRSPGGPFDPVAEHVACCVVKSADGLTA